MLTYRRTHIRYGAGLVILAGLLTTRAILAVEFTELNNLVFKAVALDQQAPDTPELPASTRNRQSHSPSDTAAHSFGAPSDTGMVGAGFTAFTDRIAAIESRSGAYAIELAETLHSLGLYYQAFDRHEEAIASFQREEHINRVHFGLFSETLLPAVKSQIQSYIAGGMLDEADEKQQYLLYLQEKCYGRNDPRLLPGLISYAEWQMERFHQAVRFEFSDMLMMPAGPGAGTKEEIRALAYERLDQAIDKYTRAINILGNNGDFDDPALYQLENRLIESMYLQASRENVLVDPDTFILHNDLSEIMGRRGEYARFVRDVYRFGIASYERVLAYIANDPAATLSRYIDTMMAFGDWYILFGKYAAGNGKYEEAQSLLNSLSLPAATVGEVMQPAVPVALPTFTALPYSEDGLNHRNRYLNPYRGYIDVSFTVNRYGSARDLEVLGSSLQTDRSIERRLKSMIRSSTYRPRLDGEQVVMNDKVSLRYYYSY